jgi:hypothetical protein
LYKAGILQWVADSKKDVGYAVWITSNAPRYSEKVRECLHFLGLTMPTDESKDIVLPVYFAVEGKKLSGVAISTRSTFDLIQILRAAVEIPQEHASAGVAISYPAMGPAGKDIGIHASKDKPERAAVAVRYRGYWFYIDETDANTKLFYLTVRALWSASIAAAADQRARPVLTIPVSR